MYRKSQFNHEVMLPGSENRVIFNFRTRNMAELNPVQQLIYDQAPFEEISSAFLKRMHARGFLSDTDEYTDFYEEMRRKKNSSKKMRLTFCTTMKCNFACDYCIETGQLFSADMSEQVQEDTLRFVRKRLAEEKPEQISVIWFGGEPLLNPSVIENLSAGLIEMADREGIPYEALVYTNGYLLSTKMIRMLERCRVRTVRISIDGSREHHDALRHLKNGRGTFDVIMDNLRNTKTDICYRIRCNLTRLNLNDYPGLVEEMKKIARETGNRIICTPERVRVEKEVDPELKKIEIPYPEYYAWFNKIRNNTVSGEPEAFVKLFEKKEAPCGACLKNTFKIDVCGNLYKCGFYLGYPDHMIGNVSEYEDESSLRTQGEVQYFSEYVISEGEKCRSCVLLPLCMGRCPYMYAVYKDRYDCHRFITDLDGIVLEAYYQMKKSRDKAENGL